MFRFFFWVLIFSSLGAASQSETLKSDKNRKNAVYGELGGTGFLFSVNYECTLFCKGQIELNGRIGAGSALLLTALPLAGINVCMGDQRGRMELGFNVVRTFAIELLGGTTTYYLGNPTIGFRYYGPKGFIFRATASPFFEMYDPDQWIKDGTLIPFAGLSFGYCF
jgi:hypothetical protein